MGCTCIPPPPVFDIPAPPDPSLVWHLLSDEPVEHLKQIQQCESYQQTSPVGITTFFSVFHFKYLPYLVIAFGATLSTMLITMIIILRIRRSKSKERAQLKKKSDCSADVILSADRHWSYNSMETGNGRGIMIYGPADDVLMHKSLPVTPSSLRLTRRGLRSLPRRPSNFTSPHVRNNLRQSATTLRLHGNADGYCTVGRTYEEIPVRRSDSETIFEDISAIHDRQVRFLLRFLINLSLPRRPSNFTSPHVRNNLRQSATTLRLHGNADGYCTVGRTYEEIPVRRSDSETIFEDISAIHDRQMMYQQQDDLQRIDMLRKPPPNCRPPPPPSQGSPLSTESSITSFDRELEQIHNSPSPKRSIEDDRKSRHSGENGRESGYGTAPSRLWNSPRTHHRPREVSNRVDSQGRPMPLAVFAQQNNAHTMTYV
uniref:Uncharacterized protein n=1 Tax=Ascaris lumbricoides TaxID=6252 RepID=A0A9J2PI64_ASCLU